MSFADTVNQKSFSLVLRMDPPKGTDCSRLLDAALAVRGRVEAISFSDNPMAIMRMHPLAACQLLLQKNVDAILTVNARDRNRLAFQSELLAAWALGVRTILLEEGENPSYGDHPLAVPCADLNTQGMLEGVSCLRDGKDMAGQPVEANPTFYVGVDIKITDDAEANRKRAASLPHLASLGAQYVVLGSTYNTATVRMFAEAAKGAGLKVFASVLMLKSLGMAKYLNSMSGVEKIPEEIIDRLAKAPIKQRACLEIAADFIRGLQDVCAGAVLLPLGWEAKVPDLLDLLQG